MPQVIQSADQLRVRERLILDECLQVLLRNGGAENRAKVILFDSEVRLLYELGE